MTAAASPVQGLSLTDPRCAEVLNALPGLSPQQHTLGRLYAAAAQWRAYGATCTLREERELAERTACNLERQAETGVATCVCCGKPFGQGTLHFAKAAGSAAA